eukprot:UN00442
MDIEKKDEKPKPAEPVVYSREKLNKTKKIGKGELETVEDNLILPAKRKIEETDETPPSKYFKAAKPDDNASYQCPFLDQINRRILDFDNT